MEESNRNQNSGISTPKCSSLLMLYYIRTCFFPILGFSKRCLLSFQNLKRELQQFLNVEIQSLFTQLESIKDCLTDQEYRDCFNQISQIKKNIESLIVNIQKCMKKILSQEINAIRLQMNSIWRQLRALKAQAQSEFDNVRTM